MKPIYSHLLNTIVMASFLSGTVASAAPVAHSKIPEPELELDPIPAPAPRPKPAPVQQAPSVAAPARDPHTQIFPWGECILPPTNDNLVALMNNAVGDLREAYAQGGMKFARQEDEDRFIDLIGDLQEISSKNGLSIYQEVSPVEASLFPWKHYDLLLRDRVLSSERGAKGVLARNVNSPLQSIPALLELATQLKGQKLLNFQTANGLSAAERVSSFQFGLCEARQAQYLIANEGKFKDAIAYTPRSLVPETEFEVKALSKQLARQELGINTRIQLAELLTKSKHPSADKAILYFRECDPIVGFFDSIQAAKVKTGRGRTAAAIAAQGAGLAGGMALSIVGLGFLAVLPMHAGTAASQSIYAKGRVVCEQ